MKIYVASSWRNYLQQAVVFMLRGCGHEVYDFRNPSEGKHGFGWRDLDPEWKGWEPEKYRRMLSHPVAAAGFQADFEAMIQADACVLVLPCGRSAHLEAGWFIGQGKPMHVLMIDQQEPELMYKLATNVLVSIPELFDVFEGA
jgi:hypothetical protein